MRLGKRDSSFVSLASPLRVADLMHIRLANPPISRCLLEICGRLIPRVCELTGGDWCKICESYKAYLRMLPSIPPARGARKVSHAYLVKTLMIICIRYSGLKGKALTVPHSNNFGRDPHKSMAGRLMMVGVLSSDAKEPRHQIGAPTMAC